MRAAVVRRMPDRLSRSGCAGSVQQRGGHRKQFGTKRGILVRDPLSTWGRTIDMGTKELLDALDRAERARLHGGVAVWERLSCRAQALAPEMTAVELCRALFAFHRAKYHDAGMIEAARDCILHEQAGANASYNDVALLLKAFSKHQCKDSTAVDYLLQRAADTLEYATPADTSQLLAAVLRLDMADHLGADGRFPELLSTLLEATCRQLDDAYLPPGDLTNLCVAAALYPPTEEGSAMLGKVAGRFSNRGHAMSTPPKDQVRRLQSFWTFDQSVQNSQSHVTPVAARLGREGLLILCKAASSSLARRASELEPETSVAACEALSHWVSVLGSQGAAAEWDVAPMHPLLALVTQRLPGLERSLAKRVLAAAERLAQVRGDSLLSALQSVGQRRSAMEESRAS